MKIEDVAQGQKNEKPVVGLDVDEYQLNRVTDRNNNVPQNVHRIPRTLRNGVSIMDARKRVVAGGKQTASVEAGWSFSIDPSADQAACRTVAITPRPRRGVFANRGASCPLAKPDSKRRRRPRTGSSRRNHTDSHNTRSRGPNRG